RRKGQVRQNQGQEGHAHRTGRHHQGEGATVLINQPADLPVAAAELTYDPQLPPVEEGGAGPGFTLLQIWHMVRAHLWLTVGIFVMLMALAYVGIKNLPKSYDARATLIVNFDNTDPLAGRNYSAGQTGTFFPTQVELIKNGAMLLPVIERLHLQTDK